MKVLVNGIGTIGATLANVLLRFQDLLEIDTVFINKNRPYPWMEPDLDHLRKNGAVICSSSESPDYTSLSDVINEIDYIFDCTAQGRGLENLKSYQSLPNLKGACSQGTEYGFGTNFMSGVNPDSIRNKKFVTVVSCNTHAISATLQTFAGENLQNLESADFVIVRRSEDIGRHGNMVSGNVIARHLDRDAGTHHVRDVIELFGQKGIDVNLTASSVTTPSQLMHACRFNITLKNPPDWNFLEKRLSKSPYVSITDKFDSNAIFDLGRRYGFQGRIFSHAIILRNNVLNSGNSIKGWCFVPQEGNTILSTIDAFLLQTENRSRDSVLNSLRDELMIKMW